MKIAGKLLVVGIIAFLALSSACKTVAKSEHFTVYENSDALLSAVEKKISTVTAKAFFELAKADSNILIIDVREPAEYKTDAVANSIHIPRGLLEFRIESEKFFTKIGKAIPKKDAPIYIYCEKGSRGALACYSLMQLGYTNVKHVVGGMAELRVNFPQLIIVPEIPEK